jgi:hypothetical protein
MSKLSLLERRRDMLLLLSVLAFGSAADGNLAKEERERTVLASMIRTLFFPSLTEEAEEKKERVVSLLFSGRSLLLWTA